MATIDYLLAGGLGLALAACSGFRVFVPLLLTGLAYRTGYLTPSPDFAWLGSWEALLVLVVATVVEMLAYYLPVVDNLLDVLATPAAFVAGSVLMTSVLPESSPWLRWGLGVLVGGGTAGVVQTGTTLLRAGSTFTTGGFGNPILATIENTLAVLGTLFGLLLPLVMGGLVVLLVVYLATRWRQRRRPDRLTAH